VSTEEPTFGQITEAWLRYIRDPREVHYPFSLPGEKAAVEKIYHDAFRAGYAQRQLDEAGTAGETT
jgi:hypothetical protein